MLQADDRVLPWLDGGHPGPPLASRRAMVAASTAARLVDEILPPVPVRQWVLSLSYEIRYRMARDRPRPSDP